MNSFYWGYVYPDHLKPKFLNIILDKKNLKYVYPAQNYNLIENEVCEDEIRKFIKYGQMRERKISFARRT